MCVRFRFLSFALSTVVCLSVATSGQASAGTATAASLQGAQLRRPVRFQGVSRTQFFRQMLQSKLTLGKFILSQKGTWKAFRGKARKHKLFSFRPLITRGCMAWLDTINAVLANKSIRLNLKERDSLVNARGVFESYLQSGELYQGRQVRSPLKPENQSWGALIKEGTRAKLAFYKVAFKNKAAWGIFGSQLKKHQVFSLRPFVARDIAAWSETIPEVLNRQDLHLKPGQRAEVQRAMGFFTGWIVPASGSGAQ